jgi:hypothetical protein
MSFHKINIDQEKGTCIICGANILDIANIAYDGEYKMDPRYREELCHCRSCNTKFIIHYDLFDAEGHVCSRVFSEDINNRDFKWQDLLNKEQLDGIAKHLESCDVCKDRLSEEMLSDAWFASVVHPKKNQ